MLSDEAALEVLRWCAPGDLGRLSAVDRRLRRLSLDENLWKTIYMRVFPLCPDHDGDPDRPTCLYRLGVSAANLDVEGLVDDALDRLLDPAVKAAGPEPDLPDAVWALAMAGHRADRCPHWWPTVLAVRGYRWAFAVAVTDVPRFFGPHLDGSEASLVGRITMYSEARYRGDLGYFPGENYTRHGYGRTVKRGPNRAPLGLKWTFGQWDWDERVRCIAASHVGRTSADEKTRGFGKRGGFYRESGDSCVFVGARAPAHRCAGHAVPALWRVRRTAEACQSQGWTMVHGADASSIAGVGHTCLGWRATGIVRVADGAVAFLGTIDKGHRPDSGRLFSAGGILLYDGDIDVGVSEARGRVYGADGCTMDIVDDSGRGAYAGRPDRLTMVVTYPNGDRATWRDMPTEIASFECADGRVYDPPDGWNTIAHPLPPSAPSLPPPLLDNTALALPDGNVALRYEREIRNMLFWPRPSPPDDCSGPVSFADHMATHHGPRWAACQVAVHALYGLPVVDL